ncbi:MAG: alpha-hydroxy-acid oxidizing protein [Rhodanobacteraceae bacterium]|nr:alpha-hydroxy-acid oxidizing protein [Rhodanobacteraceae bacterium]
MGAGCRKSLTDASESAGFVRVLALLVDSGFRRGSDIFKALALGATSVGVGRPDIWGLAAFGQPEVEQVLRILRKELLIAMRQAGTRTLAEITPAYLSKESARASRSRLTPVLRPLLRPPLQPLPLLPLLSLPRTAARRVPLRKKPPPWVRRRLRFPVPQERCRRTSLPVPACTPG